MKEDCRLVAAVCCASMVGEGQTVIDFRTQPKNTDFSSAHAVLGDWKESCLVWICYQTPYTTTFRGWSPRRRPKPMVNRSPARCFPPPWILCAPIYQTNPVPFSDTCMSTRGPRNHRRWGAQVPQRHGGEQRTPGQSRSGDGRRRPVSRGHVGHRHSARFAGRAHQSAGYPGCAPMGE